MSFGFGRQRGLRVISGFEEDSCSCSSVGGGLRQLVLAVVEVLVEVVGFERLGAGVLGFALGFGFGEAGGCEAFARRVMGTGGEVEVRAGNVGVYDCEWGLLSSWWWWCWDAVFVFEVD
jgi:hypothetical protein